MLKVDAVQWRRTKNYEATLPDDRLKRQKIRSKILKSQIKSKQYSYPDKIANEGVAHNLPDYFEQCFYLLPRMSLRQLLHSSSFGCSFGPALVWNVVKFSSVILGRKSKMTGAAAFVHSIPLESFASWNIYQWNMEASLKCWLTASTWCWTPRAVLSSSFCLSSFDLLLDHLTSWPFCSETAFFNIGNVLVTATNTMLSMCKPFWGMSVTGQCPCSAVNQNVREKILIGMRTHQYGAYTYTIHVQYFRKL